MKLSKRSIPLRTFLKKNPLETRPKSQAKKTVFPRTGQKNVPTPFFSKERLLSDPPHCDCYRDIIFFSLVNIFEWENSFV